MENPKLALSLLAVFVLAWISGFIMGQGLG